MVVGTPLQPATGVETAKGAIELGEAVKEALRDKLYTSGANEAQFYRSGVDFTDFNDTQTLHRRVMSFDVRWRPSTSGPGTRSAAISAE